MNEEKQHEETPQYIKDNGGLCERLWNATIGMLQNAKKLQSAIVVRDTEKIWAILAEKEAKSAELEQAAELWNKVFNTETSPSNPSLDEARSQIRNKLQKIQLTEKVNYNLTRGYLTAIEQSLIQAGAGLAGKKKVYDKGGRLGVKSTSFMLDTIG